MHCAAAGSAVLQEFCAQKSVDADAVAANVSAFVAFAQMQLEAQGLPRDFFAVEDLRFVFVMHEVPSLVYQLLTDHVSLNGAMQRAGTGLGRGPRARVRDPGRDPRTGDCEGDLPEGRADLQLLLLRWRCRVGPASWVSSCPVAARPERERSVRLQRSWCAHVPRTTNMTLFWLAEGNAMNSVYTLEREQLALKQGQELLPPARGPKRCCRLMYRVCALTGSTEFVGQR